MKDDIEACRRICNHLQANPKDIFDDRFAFLSMFAEWIQNWKLNNDNDAEDGPPRPPPQESHLAVPPYNPNCKDTDERSKFAKYALANVQSNEPMLALQNYKYAIHHEPSAMLYAARGNVCYKMEEYGAAIKHCDAAENINGNCSSLYKVRGKAKMALKDYNGAVKDFNKYQQLDFSEEVNTLIKQCQSNDKRVDSVHDLLTDDFFKNNDVLKKAEKILRNPTQLSALMANPVIKQMLQK